MSVSRSLEPSILSLVMTVEKATAAAVAAVAAELADNATALKTVAWLVVVVLGSLTCGLIARLLL